MHSAPQYLNMSRRHSSLSKEKALFEAVDTGDYHKVYDLLANGVNKNITNEEGKSALYLSSANGNVDLVRLLIHAGADPLIEDKEGKRAVECLEKSVMSNEARDRIYECLTGNKHVQKVASQPVDEDKSKLAADDLSMDEVVDNFTSKLSEAAKPFLCALYRNPGSARAVLRAPIGTQTVEAAIPDAVPASDTSPNNTENTETAGATPLASNLVPDVTTAEHSSPPTVSVAADNWLSPVLRTKGMADPRIVQDVCELVIGKLEYTEEGFANMTEANFEKVFAPHFTVPGRLAKLQCAHKHIHRMYREFEDNMQGLTMNGGTGASSSTALLHAAPPQQRAPPPLVTATQIVPIPPAHALTTTGNVPVSTAVNVLTNTPTSTFTMTTTVSVPAPGVSFMVSASPVPSTPRHVCALHCKCSNNVLTAGRKRGRDMTPTRVIPPDPHLSTPPLAVASCLVSTPPMAPLPLAGTYFPAYAKRRSFSPSRRAVIVPEPGKNFAGMVLAHLREKNARRTPSHQQM